MNIHEPKKLVYTAQSRHLFYARMIICKFVLEQDAVPLNPFNLWGYFLYELVDRDLVRRGNNNVIRAVDETWVFGPIADGVLAEIQYSMDLGKPLKFFTAGSKLEDIRPIKISDLAFEEGALSTVNEDDFRESLQNYLNNDLSAVAMQNGS